jgi:SDR family mycofactocin-dependent oxidoreductase
MVGVLSGKVALISGAARGQGRSHAVRLAEEGADIVAFDICRQLDSVEYPMATPDDLTETVKMVESLDRRILARQVDVRDAEGLDALVSDALGELGQIDIVLANAGIMPITGEPAMTRQAWHDAIDVMLSGVFNTIEAAVPSMLERGAGGSIVITSSTAGLKGLVKNRESFSPGVAGYTAAKHGVVGLMRMYAVSLGAHSIRCNTVHPTGVNSPMVVNEAFGQFVAEHPETADAMKNVLPVELVEPVDISNAIVWLCSDAARYVTGVTLPVDAGFTAR